MDMNELAACLYENIKGKDTTISPKNVYHQGVPENVELIGKHLDQLLLPGSNLINKNAIKQLVEYSKKGESCLLLIEHYSNFDYPLLVRMVQNDPELGPDVANMLLPIMGMKLSSTSDYTAGFSLSYDTITIYPSRSIDQIKDEAERQRVRKEISTPINHAAIKELTYRKHQGRIIIVFPAGTRYRPWDPSSRKGVREINSYLKTFDHICFVALNGNCLKPSRNENMEQDEICRDVITMTFSEIERGRTYRKKALESMPENGDPRQYVVDKVMDKLMGMHIEAEDKRKKLL